MQPTCSASSSTALMLRATLDAFNPQAPGYKALKAQLAAVRSGKAPSST